MFTPFTLRVRLFNEDRSHRHVKSILESHLAVLADDCGVVRVRSRFFDSRKSNRIRPKFAKQSEWGSVETWNGCRHKRNPIHKELNFYKISDPVQYCSAIYPCSFANAKCPQQQQRPSRSRSWCECPLRRGIRSRFWRFSRAFSHRNRTPLGALWCWRSRQDRGFTWPTWHLISPTWTFNRPIAMPRRCGTFATVS